MVLIDFQPTVIILEVSIACKISDNNSTNELSKHLEQGSPSQSQNLNFNADLADVLLDGAHAGVEEGGLRLHRLQLAQQTRHRRLDLPPTSPPGTCSPGEKGHWNEGHRLGLGLGEAFDQI